MSFFYRLGFEKLDARARVRLTGRDRAYLRDLLYLGYLTLPCLTLARRARRSKNA